MTDVQVTGLGVNTDGSPVAGSLLFWPSDWIWSDSLGVFSAGEVINAPLDGSGTPWSINLYAMDNTGVSTNWYWMVKGCLNGICLPVRALVVKSANGSTQTLQSLLDTSILYTNQFPISEIME